MTATRVDDFTRGWTAWRRLREAELTEPHGWLSLTAFHWLRETPAQLPGLPGLWSGGDFARLTAVAADGLRFEGRAVDGVLTFDLEKAGAPAWVERGRRRIEVALRGGRFAARVRDPKAPTRTGFNGIPCFPPDPDWAVTGRYLAFDEPLDAVVGSARGDLSHSLRLTGEIDFTVGGRRQSLLASTTDNGALSVLFSDRTNGDTTAAWRSLSLPPASEDGAVVLDFNRAQNLPCAFTEFGTCPKPVDANALSVAVTAGEQRPQRPL
jgi:uncharacterized protein